MHAETVTFPKAPKLPSDLVFLLTYTCGPEMSRGEFVAEETGFDCDGSTQVDELN